MAKGGACASGVDFLGSEVWKADTLRSSSMLLKHRLSDLTHLKVRELVSGLSNKRSKVVQSPAMHGYPQSQAYIVHDC